MNLIERLRDKQNMEDLEDEAANLIEQQAARISDLEVLLDNEHTSVAVLASENEKKDACIKELVAALEKADLEICRLRWQGSDLAIPSIVCPDIRAALAKVKK